MKSSQQLRSGYPNFQITCLCLFESTVKYPAIKISLKKYKYVLRFNCRARTGPSVGLVHGDGAFIGRIMTQTSQRPPQRRPWSVRRSRRDRVRTPNAAQNSAWPRLGISLGRARFTATLASFAPIGLGVGGTVGLAVGGGVAWVGFEGLKKSATYANGTAALGPRYDALQKTADEAFRARLVALATFRRFARDSEAPLRRIAENTSRLRWMLRYIDFIMKPDGERGD